MEIINKSSVLWEYLTPELQGLIEDGENLLDHASKHGGSSASDFSYLVFPFGKAYEGFLKRLFLDLDLIQEDEYYGDEIRIGRILNPHYIHEHENIFDSLCAKTGDGSDAVMTLWKTWRNGRNKVFHYFPHNFRKLTYKDAVTVIKNIVSSMELATKTCSIDRR